MLIVITGITRGLGRALAEWYMKAGHTVVGCGRNGAEIFDLRFTYPEPHAFDAVDVTEPIKVDLWSERIQGSHGVPDILINNAGLINEPAPLWKISAQEFSRVMDVNVKGTANVIRAFLPAMLARGQGVVVNFSSEWGRSVSPKMAPYCASKFAIEGLTLALAEELPEGMAAVALNPGIINTAMLQKCMPEDAEAYPDASVWAERAAPYILGLSASENGKSLTIGG